MQDFTSFREGEPRSPLPRILQVMGALGVFMLLGWLVLSGFEDLLLPAVVLGLPLYLIVLVDPILGLAILIACIGLSPEFSIGGIRNLRAEDFMIPGLLLGWFLRAGHERKPLADARIWAPALVSLAAMILSTISGASAGSVKPGAAFFIMAKYAEYLLIYLLVINLVRTEAEVRALAIFSIMVAVASATLSLTSSVSYAADVAEGRVRGPLGETANIYGGYLGVHLLLTLGFFLHSTTGGARLISGATVVLLGISILFTYSRTSYVAVGGAILIFGVIKYRRLLVILLILGILVPILAPTSVMDRMATVGGVAAGPTPYSWDARLYAWQWAMGRMSAFDSIIGKGIGSVGFGDVDSEYVRIFSDMGVLGVFLFLWLLVRIGLLASRTHDALPEYTFRRGYVAGYLMAFLTMTIHSVAATTFSAIRTEETFMILTGLMTAIANQREAAQEGESGRPVVLLRDVPVLEPQRPKAGAIGTGQ